MNRHKHHPTLHSTVTIPLLAGLSFALLTACDRVAPPTQAPSASPQPAGSPAQQPQVPVNPLAPDLPGPDGVLYPNFAHAGLAADAGAPAQVLELINFGAKAGENVAPALRRAIAEAKKLGGAVIQFGHGTFFLDEPILINGNNIVLRGMGRGGPGYFSTTIEFRYGPKPETVDFLFHKDGDSIHPEGFVGVVAHPGLTLDYWNWNLAGQARVSEDTSRQLARLEIFLNGKLWLARDTIKDHHFAPQTALLSGPQDLARAGVKPGDQLELRAVATWKNGRSAEKTLRLRADASLPDAARAQAEYAIFSFAGPSRYRPDKFFELTLTAPISRGDTRLSVASTGDFQPGDVLRIHTTKNPDHVPFGSRYLFGYYQVVSVEPGVITIDRPVRLDVPLAAEPRIRKQTPIRNVGVENMVIRQTSETWIHGIAITEGWGAWVRNVELVNIGRCPIYFASAARTEVRDVLMNGAIFHSAGGMSAYGGWFDNVHDSLMENVTSIRLRHSPNFQGQSSGNVVRNSTFENSDLQFHAFFPFENLVEHCRIYATGGTGSYGYGLYTSDVHSQHHQAGPGNVVYGNDIRSPKEPIVFGGAESGWIVAHNRFGVIANSPWLRREPMPAIRLAEGSSSNLFLKNIFSLAIPDAPILVKGAPGAGNRFVENAFLNVASSTPADGEAGWNSTWEKNHFSPAPDPARFDAWEAPPSLYLWQRRIIKNVQQP